MMVFHPKEKGRILFHHHSASNHVTVTGEAQNRGAFTQLRRATICAEDGSNNPP